MTLKTQEQLENESAENGLAKLLSECQQAESAGRASGSFYAKQILEKYVSRMKDAMALEMADAFSGKPGRYAAHIALMKQTRLEPGLVAYLSVAQTLNCVMEGNAFSDSGSPNIATALLRRNIGTAIYNEHFCRSFDDANPDLFFTLTNDLNRRQSKSAQHRTAVMKMQARKNNVNWEEWSATNLHQIGAWCIDLLVEVGMLELSTERKSATKTVSYVNLTDTCLRLIEDTKRVVSYFRPQRLPFVEKPRDWDGVFGGGYYTKRMQNTFPRALRVSPTQLDYILPRQDDFRDTVIRTINILQSVEWCVNKQILSVQQAMFKGFKESDKPDPLECHSRPDTDWTDEEKAQHKLWKREMAKWYTANKVKRYAAAKEAMSLSVAREFQDYEQIYFMYFADWRGRYYPLTTGISPQGQDYQKALLQFKHGDPLDSAEAVEFFLLLGSTKFGFDKGSIQERIEWVKQNHEIIMACADDPVMHSDWWHREADKPYQFLAWCFEYAEWKRNPGTFISRLPCSLDGTCNGLQHASGMFRDKAGAVATNLLPSDRPNDIYAQVARVVEERLRGATFTDRPLPDGERVVSAGEQRRLASLWLSHGINRKLTKRCVMTLPYGSKKFSMGKFIRKDYMMEYHPVEFDVDEYKEAASFLGEFVWNAIGEVVVKAVEGMNYYQAVCRAITRKKDCEVVRWTAPSGLPIVQTYFSTEFIQFRARQSGNTRLKVLKEKERIDKLGHANGISPNVTHSCDASHLSNVTCAAYDAGIRSFAMIHDDYGTTAAKTALLSRLIRTKFVELYESNPFEKIANELESQAVEKYIPRRPEMGDLDLSEVVNSKYFFL